MKSNLSHQISSSWSAKQKDIGQILYLYLVFAISYYYAYTISHISMDGIMDRCNYLNYAENANEIMLRWNGLSFIFNEPIWLIINNILKKMLDSPEAVIQTYIFTSAFIMSFIILKRDKRYFLYLFSIPFLWQLMNNYVVHLRQGLAITIFLIGYFSASKQVRYPLFLIASLVHSSFFIVIFIMLLDYYSKKLISSNYKRYVLQYLLFSVIALSIIYIAHLLGSRQGNLYGNIIGQISGFGFLFWLTILSIFISDTPSFQRQNSFQIALILFYLAGYFTLPVIARIFESGLVLILLSAIQLSRNKRYLFFALYSVYWLVQARTTIEYFIKI